MVRVALLLLLLAMATACNRKSLQTVESSVTVVKDSTIMRERIVFDTLVIPGSEASASVHLDSLLQNYNGLLAKYSSGSATVTVKKEGRSIIATASCDSVMQVLMHKMTELERIRGEKTVHHQTKVVEVSPPWVRKLQYGFWFIVIVAVGATIILITIKLKSVIL